MARRISYPTPHKLATQVFTPERHEDTTRGTTWTRDEIHWLRLHYGVFRAKVCADHLRRSAVSVRIMACRLRKEDNRVEEARNSRNNSREATSN